MKLTLLGTGTPTPSLKRASSGYLVEIDADVMVWDHGPGSHHRLLEAGKRATDVTHVFFSHLHYDHCADFVRLFLSRWDMGADRIPELEIHGPPGTRSFVERLFGEQGAFAPDLTARIRHQGSIDIFEARGGKLPRRWPQPKVTEVRPGDVVKGAGWEVRFGAASHVQPYLDCHGMRIDAAVGSICYSGDSGGVAPGIVELARGADVLVHMNHYMSGTEPTEIYRLVCGNPIDTAHVARQAQAKLLVLTHMLEQIDQPGVREDILKQMARIYDGPIIWGEDLMQIPIAGPKLARME
ncbi:MAG: MBL fold metallo-hydrolase [Burkholderiales bacterium]|nr:MBL fold metallo-hydrolase [Burkholderiales bacterium]